MVLTELPFGLPGRIFRSSMPFGSQDPSGKLFREFQQSAISVVVLLTDEREYRVRTGFDLKTFYVENGMEVLHCPIPDYGTPSRAELEALIPQIIAHAGQGRNLVIHCFAGIGRTGLVAACLARRIMGLSGDDAIFWVREFIPEAVESGEQRDLVRIFEEK